MEPEKNSGKKKNNNNNNSTIHAIYIYFVRTSLVHVVGCHQSRFGCLYKLKQKRIYSTQVPGSRAVDATTQALNNIACFNFRVHLLSFIETEKNIQGTTSEQESSRWNSKSAQQHTAFHLSKLFARVHLRKVFVRHGNIES